MYWSMRMIDLKNLSAQKRNSYSAIFGDLEKAV